MQVSINGQVTSLPGLNSEATIARLLDELAIKPDRVAVEHNGKIVRRAAWEQAAVHDGDRFEIVHFVGGGAW